MIKLESDDRFDYFLDFFQGTPVKILRDKTTGEVLFDVESITNVFGYDSVEALMSSDAVLDLINDELKQGHNPIRRIN